MFTKETRVISTPGFEIDDVQPLIWAKKNEMIKDNKTVWSFNETNGVYTRQFVDEDAANEWIEFVLTLVDSNGVHFTTRENIEIHNI